jgi:RNA polymerase sigma-70 factor (ECF subfamily)
MDADDEDGAVIHAVRCGDKEAFRHLVDRHQGRVRGQIRRELGRAGNSVVIEELTQDTFVEAWRDLGQYRHEGSFGAWLASIASHSTSDRRRRSRRSPTTSLDALEAAFTPGDRTTAVFEPRATGAGSEPLAELILRETVEQTIASLGRLPARDRTVVIGRHVDNITYAALAALTHEPIATLRARERRALRKLRKALQVEK